MKLQTHKDFMRKIQALALTLLLMVAATGFANVKVYDTGPPVTDYTCIIKKDLNVEASAIIGTVAVVNQFATDVGIPDETSSTIIYYEKADEVTTGESNLAFIDRHRRTQNSENIDFEISLDHYNTQDNTGPPPKRE